LAFNAEGDTKITDCIFDSCNAVKIGGAFSGCGSGASFTLIISHLVFLNSFAGIEKGVDISFEDDSEVIF
jgi:hypothetical protein